MGWTLIEPCCGSAAVSLALLGARRPLLPYQGSKWRFRKRLLAVLREAGGSAAPEQLAVFDVGPWGRVAPLVIDRDARTQVVGVLNDYAQRDARAVFDALQHQPVPEDDVEYAAQFLFLQRLAYSGKAVGDRDGRWRSPGFNTSSAYGLPGTDRFGAVRPMVPSLIDVLRSYDSLRSLPVHGGRVAAQTPVERVRRPTVVYLDPPYAGSTSYPAGDLSRAGVVALARAWHDAGAAVVISEGEGIPELAADGWSTAVLNSGRQDSSRFRGKQQEWLTLSPNVAPPPVLEQET